MESTAGDTSEQKRVITVILTIILFILVIWGLKASSTVSIPIVAGFFVAVLVRPVQGELYERLPRHFRWLSYLITALLVVAILAAVVVLFYISYQVVAAKIPQYQQRITEVWRDLSEWAEGRGIPLERGLRSSTVAAWAGATAANFAWNTIEVIAYMALILFVALLMLIEVSDWRGKVYRAFDEERARTIVRTTETLAVKILRYLQVRTGIGLFEGIAEGTWLWLIGVDFAFMWGVLIFLFNFVPYIGAIIGFVLPTMTAFLQYGPAWALVSMLGQMTLEQITSNIIDPRLAGRALRISPIVVLIAVLFWGWVWGIPGALLGVPITVTLLIVCAYVPPLAPVAIMLSRSPQESFIDRTGKTPKKDSGRENAGQNEAGGDRERPKRPGEDDAGGP